MADQTVIEIDVTQRLQDWHGKIIEQKRPVYDAETRQVKVGDDGQAVFEVLPEEDQPTIGSIILSLVGTYKPTDTKKAVMASRICHKVADAMDAGEVYRAGEPVIGLIRETIVQNNAVLPIISLAAVLKIIGVGEDIPEV